MYKHFSFDLWLTLIKSNPLFKKKRDVAFKEFFSIDASIESVSDVIRYYDRLCNQISEKTGQHIHTHQIYYLILSALKIDLNKVNDDQLEQYYVCSEELFWEYKPRLIFPEINLLFKQIRSEGKTISILSNTAFIKGSALRKLLSHYELSDFFSFQLYSDEMKFSKPNKQVFEYAYESALKHQKLSKKEIAHIGDNRFADYDGAINSGFNAILIQNKNEVEI